MAYVILGTGSDLPPLVVSNDDIEATTPGWDRVRAGQSLDDWARRGAGVATRHRLPPGEAMSEMAARAVERALADAGLAVDEVDLIVLGTFTSDARLPSTVSLVAQALGSGAKCLQLESACTGFLDALLVATALMGTGPYRTAVVVAVEAMSAVVDPQHLIHQTIFGDGAAAVVVRDLPGTVYGIEALRSHTDASLCDWTSAPRAGGYLGLDHRAIYRFAVDKMVETTHEVLTVIDRTLDDVDWLIPHQTGANVIGEAVEQLKVPPERVITCLDHTGNVSGASVAIALDEAQRQGRLGDGDRVVISTVGAGMAWGAASLIWRRPRPGAPA